MATTALGGKESVKPAGRMHGYVHTAIALAVAILVAAVALTTRQPPPPQIAEFAPQAVEQIKDAPKNQISDYGSGQGDCPPDVPLCDQGEGAGQFAGGTTTTSTVPPGARPGVLIDKARARQCVGNPPRQIEDPQSPPCVPYWDNSMGNGGATARGVTADTITVTIDNEELFAAQIYERFFNDRFELYGRQIRFVGDGAAGETRSRADNAKELKAFATIGFQDINSIFDQLAKNKIIGISRQANFTDAELARMAPYIWSYPMSASQQLGGMADWTCSRLAGRTAEFAGTSTPGFGGRAAPTDLKTVPRKFGAFLRKIDPDSSVSLDVLNTALGSCGQRLGYTATHTAFESNFREDYWTNEMVKMKNDGITTIFAFMEGWPLLESAQSAANKQGYFPEWIVSSYPHYYGGFFGAGPSRGANREQLAHTMGLIYVPMDRVSTDYPNRWAWVGAGQSWGADKDASTAIPSGSLYHPLLLLASGIQMAGPNLTVDTFAEGLHRTKFPNPDHPIKAGKVGFDEGDFSMTNDGIEMWWDVDGWGPYADQAPGEGTFCFDDVEGRRSRGQWPRTKPRLFDPSNCDDGRKPAS